LNFVLVMGERTFIVLQWVAYFLLGIWKFKGLGKRVDKESCSLCRQDENGMGTHLKYMEKQRWSEKLLNCKY
jgi:hypothetical protein